MTALTDDELWSAIADPSRRQVLDLLVSNGGVSASWLAGRVPFSRQAVAKHLVVLERAGFISRRKQGREVLYQVEAGRLDQAARAMAELAAQWDRRLAAIQRQLGPDQPPSLLLANLDREIDGVALQDLAEPLSRGRSVQPLRDNLRLQPLDLRTHRQMKLPLLPEKQALFEADKHCRYGREDGSSPVIMHGGQQASCRRAYQRAHGRHDIECHRKQLPAPLESQLPLNYFSYVFECDVACCRRQRCPPLAVVTQPGARRPRAR